MNIVTNTDKRAIGVFDSGVGGLSILLEIKRLLPQESFVFLADQKHVPYGTKTKKQLEALVSAIVKFLEEQDVKMVVVACNTATVYTIDYLRQNFSFPIVGVVPVIKTLASITCTKKVGVLATPATSKSSYLFTLINKFAPGIEVSTLGGTGLEEMVEEGVITGEKIKQHLQTLLNPLLEKGIDALALGCTHYPFLRPEIEKIVSSGVQVVDSGGAVARQVKKILETNNQLAVGPGKDRYYTTGRSNLFNKVASYLTGETIVATTVDLNVNLERVMEK